MSGYDFAGETIGSYRIFERIGHGGMGRVYRGVHVHLDRVGAVKVMHGHLASDPDFEARFRREARAAASLEHPNIVAIHDFGEQDGLLYLIMELLTEGSVRTLLREQPAGTWLDQVAGIDLVRQAAEGLAHAHRQGMIHRDIKPENLLLKRIDDEPDEAASYVVKVADFGLARMAEGSTMTMSGTLMGTPPYMSPEQCQGFDLDPRSDQYSLGIVLYEVVTGRKPFEPNTPTEAAYKHVFVEPPSPTDFRPGLDGELIAVILRALSKRPDERFATTGEFVRALRSIQARLARVDLDPYTSPPHGIATMPYVEPRPVGLDTNLSSGAMTDSPTVATPVVGIMTAPQVISDPKIEFSLDRTAFTVTPGEPASVRGFVANHGVAPAQLALAIRGLPAEWVRISTPSIMLDPGEQTTVDVWIDIPPAAEEVSGQYAVTVSLRADDHADDIATTTARLELLPPPSPLVVVPRRPRDAREAEYEVRLRHDGGQLERYALLFESDTDALNHRLEPDLVALDSGATATAALSIKTRPYRFGPARQHPFTIVAEGRESGVRRDAAGVFQQTSLIPLWAPAVLAVALIIVALVLSTILGGGGGESVAAAAPRIEGVTIDPPNPVAGQPVTIHWEVIDADQIDIVPLVTGLDPSTGSYTFPNGIDGGGDLTLVASNDDGTAEERVPLSIAAETATVTPTEAVSPSVTSEPTTARTVTATWTPTNRPIVTRTPTATATVTQTATPDPTQTSTPEPTPTATPVPRPTNTPVPPPTNTPVPPPPTPTPVPPPPTNTPVPPPTPTPVPPTPTPYPTPPPVVDPTEPAEYPTPPPVG